jgi:hypothetical protein
VTPSAEPGAEVGETAAIDQTQPAAGQGGATEQGSPAEADDEGQAAMTAPEGVESCATAIAHLEEDLTRAEEAGISTVDARNELESAQAMLNRDSQALCRAAIKRAQDKLVAQGFTPAEAN